MGERERGRDGRQRERDTEIKMAIILEPHRNNLGSVSHLVSVNPARFGIVLECVCRVLCVLKTVSYYFQMLFDQTLK